VFGEMQDYSGQNIGYLFIYVFVGDKKRRWTGG